MTWARAEEASTHLIRGVAMEIATFAVSHSTLLADIDAAALPVLREQERSVPNGGALDRTLNARVRFVAQELTHSCQHDTANR